MTATPARRASRAAYYQKNKDGILARSRAYHAEHKDERRARDAVKKTIREDQHGTSTGYGYGCRCEGCRVAGADRRRRYRERYPERVAESRRRSRAENPDKHAEQWRIRQYGIDNSQWNDLFLSQGGRCGCCEADIPGGNGKWHTDHCHKTGQVRGILCNGCNTGLGCFSDDPARLSAAIKYLGGEL